MSFFICKSFILIFECPWEVHLHKAVWLSCLSQLCYCIYLSSSHCSSRLRLNVVVTPPANRVRPVVFQSHPRSSNLQATSDFKFISTEYMNFSMNRKLNFYYRGCSDVLPNELSHSQRADKGHMQLTAYSCSFPANMWISHWQMCRWT